MKDEFTGRVVLSLKKSYFSAGTRTSWAHWENYIQANEEWNNRAHCQNNNRTNYQNDDSYIWHSHRYSLNSYYIITEIISIRHMCYLTRFFSPDKMSTIYELSKSLILLRFIDIGHVEDFPKADIEKDPAIQINNFSKPRWPTVFMSESAVKDSGFRVHHHLYMLCWTILYKQQIIYIYILDRLLRIAIILMFSRLKYLHSDFMKYEINGCRNHNRWQWIIRQAELKNSLSPLSLLMVPFVSFVSFVPFVPFFLLILFPLSLLSLLKFTNLCLFCRSRDFSFFPTTFCRRQKDQWGIRNQAWI